MSQPGSWPVDGVRFGQRNEWSVASQQQARLPGVEVVLIDDDWRVQKP